MLIASSEETTVEKFIFGNKKELENKRLKNDEQEYITSHFDSFWWINLTLKQSHELAADAFSLKV